MGIIVTVRFPTLAMFVIGKRVLIRTNVVGDPRFQVFTAPVVCGIGVHVLLGNICWFWTGRTLNTDGPVRIAP